MEDKESRKMVRLRLSQPLSVAMSSIGSDVKYDLVTRDISNRGFFLDFDKPGRFPFTPSSIMEVWMMLDGEETIFFNGKMARVVYPGQNEGDQAEPGIAIKIIQIDAEQEARLTDFIKNAAPVEKESVSLLDDES